MVRSSDACCVLGLKSAAQAAAFGLACAALGAVVASYCWASLELDVAVSPRLIEGVKPASARKAVARGVNSGADLVAEVTCSESGCSQETECPSSLHGENTTATCPHCALKKAKLACDGPFAVPFVPLHQRPDYCACPPDILMVKVERLSAEGTQAELLPISGEYLIQPDGELDINELGKVQAGGLTTKEIKSKIQQALDTAESKHRVEVSVCSQNSRVYYVFDESKGLGETVTRYPVEGNETALDALAQHGRISQLVHRKVWIARPMPGSSVPDAIVPISWKWTSPDTMVCNNPPLQPGDRIFITSPPSWMTFLERTAALAKHLQASRVAPTAPEQPQTH